MCAWWRRASSLISRSPAKPFRSSSPCTPSPPGALKLKSRPRLQLRPPNPPEPIPQRALVESKRKKVRMMYFTLHIRHRSCVYLNNTVFFFFYCRWKQIKDNEADSERRSSCRSRLGSGELRSRSGSEREDLQRNTGSRGHRQRHKFVLQTTAAGG